MAEVTPFCAYEQVFLAAALVTPPPPPVLKVVVDRQSMMIHPTIIGWRVFIGVVIKGMAFRDRHLGSQANVSSQMRYTREVARMTPCALGICLAIASPLGSLFYIRVMSYFSATAQSAAIRQTIPLLLFACTIILVGQNSFSRGA